MGACPPSRLGPHPPCPHPPRVQPRATDEPRGELPSTAEATAQPAPTASLLLFALASAGRKYTVIEENAAPPTPRKDKKDKKSDKSDKKSDKKVPLPPPRPA